MPEVCPARPEDSGLKMKDHDYKEIDYVRRKENIIQRHAGNR